MASPSETTETVDGCKTKLRRAGSGEPLLFLHGAGGVPAWFPCFDQLSDGFDLLVPDHPSFGHSETPDWLDDMSDMAYYYLDFLKQLDLDEESAFRRLQNVASSHHRKLVEAAEMIVVASDALQSHDDS